MVICLIIIIVVAYICRDCKSTKRRQFDCWIIYIIILGILVACGLVCMLVYIVYIAKERVDGLKVVSRRSNGKRMAIKLEWTSRLHKYKTFYMVLNNETNSRKLDCTLRKDGVMEFELTDLKLDYDYIACLYSTMCIMQSSKYLIKFNTKGRPLPPYEVCEDETFRTESSVTLTWQQAKGPKHHFIIKYQRSKGKNRNWMYTEKINDTKYTIEGLKPNTSYTLIINAENDIGPSEDSEPLYVKTRALQPIPPEDFRCISIKESEVILSWKPSGKVKKQEFILTIYNMSEESKSGTKLRDTEISIPNTGKKVVTHKVTDLKPGSKYLFELFSAAGKLMSERSAITSVETEESGDVGDGVLSTNKCSNLTTVFHVTHN